MAVISILIVFITITNKITMKDFPGQKQSGVVKEGAEADWDKKEEP